jgi:hypothetical protein
MKESIVGRVILAVRSLFKRPEARRTARVLKAETRDKALPTSEVVEGGPRRDLSTPGEGVLTSTLNDRDAATG